MAPRKNAKVHVKAKDGAKPPVGKNGKKSDSGSGGGSFFTWFMVLALLGVWTSVAVVYFDLVDYQGVLGKLVAYDTDGDGDFDVEDAKVLLDEKEDVAKKGAKKENTLTTGKLREALKQQLILIHERVEAKKIAKLALAEVRHLLAKEEEDKVLELKRGEMTAKAKERVAARLKEEEEKIEREEMEKALEKLRREKAKEQETKEGREKDRESRKGGEREEKKERRAEGEGKKAQEEDRGKGKESARDKGKKSKSDKGGRK